MARPRPGRGPARATRCRRRWARRSTPRTAEPRRHRNARTRAVGDLAAPAGPGRGTPARGDADPDHARGQGQTRSARDDEGGHDLLPGPPPPRSPQQDGTGDPADERHDRPGGQQEHRGDLGGDRGSGEPADQTDGTGGRVELLIVVPGGGDDLRRGTEPVQQSAQFGFGARLPARARLGDVAGDLIHQLAPAIFGQDSRGEAEAPQVVVHHRISHEVVHRLPVHRLLLSPAMRRPSRGNGATRR